MFPKTLFNSWLIVFIMNPILCVVCMGVLDLNTLQVSFYFFITLEPRVE